MPRVHPPYGFTEPARRMRNRAERRCGSCINEQLRSSDEIGGDGTPRIDTSPGPVDINNANGDVANMIVESAEGKGHACRNEAHDGSLPGRACNR